MTREVRLGAFIVALRNHDPIAAIQAEADVQELLTELAKAREDAARLDWREQNPHNPGPLPKWQDIHDPPGIVWVYGPKQTQYKTLRQALDAAREKGGAE